MIHSRQIVEYNPFRLRKHAEAARTVLVRMNNETWSKISSPCWLREDLIREIRVSALVRRRETQVRFY